jgi:CHASE2 domain-containing sensor protein
LGAVYFNGQLEMKKPPLRKHYPRKHPQPKGWAGFIKKTDPEKLFWNLVAFSLLCLGMQFAELTRPGQRAIDEGYDSLVVKNYEQAVVGGRDHRPISEDLRLVLFDERAYRTSYTRGYWTPREELGRAVLNTVKRGARAVLVDFNFTEKAPVVIKEQKMLDGDAKYLEYLASAAELARQQKTVILVPLMPPGPTPPRDYLELLSRYRDVFRPANFEAFRDGHDRKVRRFRWFTYGGDYAPVLSANLLASLAWTFKDQEAAAAREAKGLLVGAVNHSEILPENLARALGPDSQKASSRLIYRLIPREVVTRKFGSGPDLTKGVVWLPGQVAGPNLAEPDFKDKIVLIGSDFKENGDYHETAFGQMAGSYILANSLNMVLTGHLFAESRWLNLAFLVLIGLLASFLYARFTVFGPTVFIFSMGLVSTWLNAWVFNHYGLFLDVWLPALGLSLYNILVGRTKFYFGRQGLIRALFKG